MSRQQQQQQMNLQLAKSRFGLTTMTVGGNKNHTNSISDKTLSLKGFTHFLQAKASFT